MLDNKTDQRTVNEYVLERLSTYPTDIKRTLYGTHHLNVTPVSQYAPGKWCMPGTKEQDSEFSEGGNALLNLLTWTSGHGIAKIQFVKPQVQNYWTVSANIGKWKLSSSDKTICVSEVLYEPTRGHAPIQVAQWAALILTGLETPPDDHVELPWPIPAAFIATYGKHVSDEVAVQLAVNEPSIAFRLFEQGCRAPEVLAIAATHHSEDTGRREDEVRFEDVFLSLTNEEYDETFPFFVERMANGPLWRQELLVGLPQCPSEVIVRLAEQSPRVKEKVMQSRFVPDRTKMLIGFFDENM